MPYKRDYTNFDEENFIKDRKTESDKKYSENK